MTKEEILYNVGLTEKVYSEQKDIDFKSLGLKLVKWIEDKNPILRDSLQQKINQFILFGEAVHLKRISKMMHQLIKFLSLKKVKRFILDSNHRGKQLKIKHIRR